MPTMKAGAIVLDQSKEHVLMVHRLKKNDWSFPKGHVESGETAEQAAIRETAEETGYSIQILGDLPELQYQTNDGESVVLSMFLAIATEKGREPEEGSLTEWIPRPELEKRLRYENLREYWRSIHQKLYIQDNSAKGS